MEESNTSKNIPDNNILKTNIKISDNMKTTKNNASIEANENIENDLDKSDKSIK